MTQPTGSPAPISRDVAGGYLAAMDGDAYRSMVLRAVASSSYSATQVELELEIQYGPKGPMDLQLRVGNLPERRLEGIRREDLLPLFRAMRDLLLQAVESGLLPSDPAELKPAWLKRLADEGEAADA